MFNTATACKTVRLPTMNSVEIKIVTTEARTLSFGNSFGNGHFASLNADVITFCPILHDQDQVGKICLVADWVPTPVISTLTNFTHQ